MGIVDNQFRTVTCDGGCGKTVTYEQGRQGPADPKIMEDNLWLKSNRLVLTSDGRNFGYCD